MAHPIQRRCRSIMHRAARILLYLVGTFIALLGVGSFVQGLFVPMIIMEPWIFMGALFFIGGIVVIWAAARTRKPKVSRQGAWRYVA